MFIYRYDIDVYAYFHFSCLVLLSIFLNVSIYVHKSFHMFKLLMNSFISYYLVFVLRYMHIFLVINIFF
jgi:hypothetical protein